MKKKHERISFLIKLILPKIQDIFFVGIFLAVIGIGPRMLNIDGDLGRHITVGNYILDTHSIPTKDIFSHTMYGQTLTPHEWLSEVVFALVYRLGGLNGIILCCAILLAVVFVFVYRVCLARSQSIISALTLTLIAAAASSFHWLARPHLFTLLFVTSWGWLLYGIVYEKKGNRWVWLPVVMLVWVNMHGAFIAGFVLWTMYLFGLLTDIFLQKSKFEEHGETIKRLMLGGVASLVVTGINPAGLRIWETSVGFLRNKYLVTHTAEYMSPNFHEISALPFLGMILLTILIVGLNRKQNTATDVYLIGGWMMMGLISIRNVPIFAVISAPILASGLMDLWKGYFKKSGIFQRDKNLQRIDWALFGYFVPMLVVILTSWGLFSGLTLDYSGRGNVFYNDVFPVQAVNWLEDNPQEGNMFNYFPWGGYLLFRMWPDKLVFIDGQTDFYGESLTREYEEVITLGDDWEDVFDKYKVDWLIIPDDTRLAHELLQSRKWNQVYEDSTAMVFQCP